MSQRYGRSAARSYDATRESRRRWLRENEVVAGMLRDARGSVLDVPVGTGRFLGLYRSLGLAVTGVDISEHMLAEARRRVRGGDKTTLSVGDATSLEHASKSHDSVVCVRLLNLMSEENMTRALLECCRVARSRVVLTIRLGPEYVLGATTAVHDEKRFARAVASADWRVAEKVPVLRWRVICLRRKT
jgi:ubiquinone/menaquinone biosynthesis C-methylase UbiE